MKSIFISIFLIYSSLFSEAQNKIRRDSLYHTEIGERIYLDGSIHIDSIAEFIGGPTAMFNFIFKQIKYPNDARIKLVEGKVYSTFVVEKDSSITDIKIIQSLSKSCDNEVLKMLSLTSQKWKPAFKNGLPVRMQFILPVVFKLDESAKKKH